MDNELKERIGWIYENVDEIDSMPIFDEIREKEPEFNIKNDVKTDLITFIMYLMLESGEVSGILRRKILKSLYIVQKMS